ncbi:hypothetical protein CV770_25230 [Bradyrhizobium sp. AC87j1]|uniref:hypothetical protein n=1 Tax=Bradyrhizobium sp. AC87j1 TaxID=2055894 RepID=UPI000CEC8139|nr:hypothetical protein [Bradyrhizobium sp. AC87j1]PPQ16623.1 hypothetical protein CV770_25230 [Bradyrhizobium sp. AC87j1]
MSYERTRDTLARAHATLGRLADIDAQIARRRAREALGLIPEYTPKPLQETAGETDHEGSMSFELFEGVMKEVIYLLRCEFGQELAALREEVQALKRRRRRKGKATATTSTEDRSDDHTS